MDRFEKRRTIYFVWNYLNWGGAQIYLLAIIKSARREWDILVLLPEGSSAELLGYLDEYEVKYEFLDNSLDNSAARSVSEKFSRQFARIRSEIEIFRRLTSFDLRNSIVHIELAPWQSWQLLTLLSLKRANVFFTLHNFLSGGSTLRRAIWKARTLFVSRLPGMHMFASNADAKERFRGWFSTRFYDSIEVTYTSVDPIQITEASRVDRDSIRTKFGVAADDFVVLCVGQFVDRKGRWVFLDAAADLLSRGEKITYVWLMPQLPDEAENVEIKRFGLGEHFRPILSSEVGSNRLDILKMFKIADVFALASYVEGLPIAMLEAMALGLPSISTNVFAISEAVTHEKTGLLIESGDGNALAESILRLKNDPEMARTLAENGRNFVLQHFDERVAANTVIQSYKRCFPND